MLSAATIAVCSPMAKQAPANLSAYSVHPPTKIEIYSEQVRDLLNPIANAKGLSVHERPGKGFHSKFFFSSNRSN